MHRTSHGDVRMKRRSILTCPDCGRAQTLTMPGDVCVIVYECPACHARLTPKEGDCCVFCSYGDVPCPPVQAEKECWPAGR